MNPPPYDVDVLVIGAGPVGLSAALQLGRAGVRTLVAERHAGLAHHPKAIDIHARTMESFRQWGLAGKVRDVGLPLERCLGFAWLTRLNGLELGRIMLAEDGDRMAEFAAQSPEPPCFAAQDMVEPVLRDAALLEPCVELRMSTTVTDLMQDDEGVHAVLRAPTGETQRVRARYVVAADGTRSPTRTALGVRETAEPPYGESVNVYFRADLDHLVAGRPYLLWWTINRDVQGTFWPTTTDGRWIFNFKGDVGKPDEAFGADLCRGLIRAGAGDPGLDVEILDVLRWRHEQAVADTWRVGRVLLAGDAAHRFPPHGGFGMNSGIQDTVNLSWKLAAVLSGEAGDALLDTYQEERRPVAVYNAEQVALNTSRMTETGWLMTDPATLDTIEEPEGEPVRRAIADAVPRQREQFYSQGQQFGQVYTSAAVVDDGTTAPTSTVSTYVPTTHPGARFPHLWVRRADGTDLSTLDLLGPGLVLFTGVGPGGDAWAAAARQTPAGAGRSIAAYRIGADGDHADLTAPDPDGLALLGIGSDGAVLVRPDGQVALRETGAAHDPTARLRAAVDQVLARGDRSARPRR